MMYRCLAGLGMGIVAGGIVLSSVAFAQMAPSDVRLLPGWQAADGTHMAAIEITLAPGWKTYWRAPGEYGIPPKFDMSASRNIAAFDPIWPRPEIMDTLGEKVLGYHDYLLLPVRITPQDPNAPIEVQIDMLYGVCDDICVAADASFGAALLPGQDGFRAPIEYALSLQAEQIAPADVRCHMTPKGAGFAFTADLATLPEIGPSAHVVIETPVEDMWVSDITLSDRAALSAVFDYYGDGMLALSRSDITISVVEPDRLREVPGCTG